MKKRMNVESVADPQKKGRWAFLVLVWIENTQLNFISSTIILTRLSLYYWILLFFLETPSSNHVFALVR